MPDPAIVSVIGLALLAAGGWWQARKWRRAYQRALAQYATLLHAVPKGQAKSPAHVKAAKTRAARERAKRLAVANRLAAEVAARAPAGGYNPDLVRSGWQ